MAAKVAVTCSTQACERTAAHIAEVLCDTGSNNESHEVGATSTVDAEQDTVLTSPNVMVSIARPLADATKPAATCSMPARNAYSRHTNTRPDAPESARAPVRPQVNSGRAENPATEPRGASGESIASMERATALHAAHAKVGDSQMDASIEAPEAELGAARAREQDEDLHALYEQRAEVRDALPHAGALPSTPTAWQERSAA